MDLLFTYLQGQSFSIQSKEILVNQHQLQHQIVIMLSELIIKDIELKPQIELIYLVNNYSQNQRE